MTIPGSTSPDARQWLFDQLTASLTADATDPASELLVCFDEPGPYMPNDVVSVGAVTRDINTNSLVGSGGAGWLEEKYRVSIDIEVYRGGDEAQRAYTRASALADGAAYVVRADPTMGGAVLISRPVSSSCEVNWDDDHLGRQASATVVIECYQRI